ncbi:hypothetical protein GCM10027572_06480 [Flexivirga lutea]
MSTERGQPHAAIVTAAFSIATAYGAAIALVTPKDKQAPGVVLTPFIALAVAVTIAMVGKAAGISLGPVHTVDEARDSIRTAVRKKRVASWVAIVVLGFGLVVAGFVLNATFSAS